MLQRTHERMSVETHNARVRFSVTCRQKLFRSNAKTPIQGYYSCANYSRVDVAAAVGVSAADGRVTPS